MSNTTVEKTNEVIPSTAGNQFFGKIPEREENFRECAIIGLIKNQKIVLEEELEKAKLKYADAMLEKDNWSEKYEMQTACRILESQIHILSKMESDIENMLIPAETTPN